MSKDKVSISWKYTLQFIHSHNYLLNLTESFLLLNLNTDFCIIVIKYCIHNCINRQGIPNIIDLI